MYTPAPTRLSLSPGTPQKSPWCHLTSRRAHRVHRHLSIIVHHQSIGPTGRPSSAKRIWLFGKNINFISFFLKLLHARNVNEIINWKSNVVRDNRDSTGSEKLLCYRQTAITNHPKRVQRLDMYRLYATYTSIYICIYIRNVNWSSKTWSTCTWGSFYVSFSRFVVGTFVFFFYFLISFVTLSYIASWYFPHR